MMLEGRKPLVVLSGWLGSSPRHLRKVEEFYRSLGFQVITRIPTPIMVFRQCFPLAPLQVPRNWPKEPWMAPASIQDIAWEVLREIHHSGCDFFILHCWSNAGCFVYEMIRNIFGLQSSPRSPLTPSITRIQESVLFDLKQRYAGGIFDSCPGRELSDVDRAMANCLPYELRQLQILGGADWWLRHTTAVKQRMDERAHSYNDAFRFDTWGLPQCFFYSQADEMIPCDVIQDVVRERKARFPDRVREKVWKDSQHCGHIRMHDEEYKKALSSFLKECLQWQREPQPRSRL